MTDTCVTILYNLWIGWLKFTNYNFFEAWGSFWLMLSDFYRKWIDENPLESQNIMNSFINKYDNCASYDDYHVQFYVITAMYTSNYLRESKFETISNWKQRYDKNSKVNDEVSDALTLFKVTSNECYRPFVDAFQKMYNKSIFNDV